jgi:hypothetical protein
VAEAVWEQLGEAEYAEVWERFQREFGFRPGTEPESFPAIREPSPSLTYALPRIPGGSPSDGQSGRHGPTDDEIDDLIDSLLEAFRACTPSGGKIYALDWRHRCYWFRPRARFQRWKIPLLPDGDYYIFLAPDFSWGLFGHPWEWTVCVFGAPLLAALERRRPKVFQQPLRTS